MGDKVYKILFLCAGSSARSIFGECLVNRLGRGKVQGFSADSHPKGGVHPMALYELQHNNYATDEICSLDSLDKLRLQEKLDEVDQIRLTDTRELAA